MANALYRLGKFAYRRWPIVMIGWLIAILAVAGFGAAKSQPFSTSFSIPGIPSVEAAETQTKLFPGSKSAADEATAQIVVSAPEGRTLSQQPYAGQVDELVKSLQSTPQVSNSVRQTIVNPVRAAPAQKQQLLKAAQQQGTPQAVAEKNAAVLSPLSADGRIGTITFDFDAKSSMDVTQATRDHVNNAVEKASANGLTAVAGGTGLQEFELGYTSELIGIGVALLVLLLTFGSFVAAGLPILNAVVGVALGLLGVTAATAFVDMPDTATALASMIGLAVGIDYALFILSRYRSELRHTDDRQHAIGIALGTAGSAVVFAGLTVIIALAAFSVLGISILTYMGLSAAVTVFIAVLVAITLLPALMGMLKSKAFAGRIRKDHAADETDHDFTNNSVRLGKGIRKAPWLATLIIVLGLGALATPIKDLHLGLPSDATAAVGTEARTSADLLADGWGPGKNAPMIAVVDATKLNGNQRQAAFGEVVRWASADNGVANAQVVQANEPGTGAIVLITPKTGPADSATDDLLERLRDGQGQLESRTGASVGITGLTAIQADVSQKMNDALPPYLAIVVGLAFLILVLVFRSLVVPLMATLGFLLSVLATLGVTVKLVQDGAFGLFDPQPIMSFMPTLLIGIVFGLAMDYQVFLTTRMREAYTHGMDPRDAVIDGYRHSGRVVTAAAVIMISVFAAFAFQDNALIKSIGVALAVAVFLDAFLVRMILIPAVMLMIGDRAWWIPKWLDKVLPNVDVEGESLQRIVATENQTGSAAADSESAATQARTVAPATASAGVSDRRGSTDERRSTGAGGHTAPAHTTGAVATTATADTTASREAAAVTSRRDARRARAESAVDTTSARPSSTAGDAAPAAVGPIPAEQVTPVAAGLAGTGLVLMLIGIWRRLRG